ncbi:MAG: hypothetical protein MUC51_03075 [Anaerolineae bacterium]|nr:hypothetical protein [Anaerolineae bacterium]
MQPVRLVIALLTLSCLLAACQTLPTEPPAETSETAEAVAMVAAASVTPEPAVTTTPTPRPRFARSATLHTGEPSVLELVPLGLGASWVYSVTLIIPGDEENAPLYWTGVVTETITDVQQMLNAWTYRSETTGQPALASPPREPVQIYVPLGGRLYQLSESLDPAEMIVAGGQGYEGERVVTWPLAVGQTWADPNLVADEGPPYYWLVEAEEEVRTAAGAFTGCYRIVFRGETDDTTSWFCPAVGLVRYRYRHPEAEQYESWELLSWRPGSPTQE